MSAFDRLRAATRASDPSSHPDRRMAAVTGPLDIPRFQVLTPAALEAFTKAGPPEGAFVYTNTPGGDEDQLQQWVRDHWEVVGKVYIGDAAQSDDLAVRVSPTPFQYPGGVGGGGSAVGVAPRGPNDPDITSPMGGSPCPPCPPPIVITCSGSLAAVQVASIDTQAYNAGNVDLLITPLDGEPSVVLACMVARNNDTPPDQDMTADGDYIQLAGNVNAPAGHPTTGVFYRPAVSGPNIVTGHYTKGFGASVWGGCAIAFRSSANSPRQSGSFNYGSGSSSSTVTLSQPVLSGSLVVIAVGYRNRSPIPGGSAVLPSGGKLIAEAEIALGMVGNPDGAAIYAICGASGDTFGIGGINEQKFVSVSEWVI